MFKVGWAKLCCLVIYVYHIYFIFFFFFEKAKYPFYYNFFLHKLFNLDSSSNLSLPSKEKGLAYYNMKKRLLGNNNFKF